MKNILCLSLLAATAIISTGCMSDPVNQARFKNTSAFGEIYTPVLPCTFRTLSHADKMSAGYSLTKSDFRILLGSTLRLPFDLVTDVVFLPYDLYLTCNNDWQDSE